MNQQGKTYFAVHHNQPRKAFVMAFICPCGAPSIAFGGEAYGMFTSDPCGKCGGQSAVAANG